jgi:hypothetical protein
MKGSSHISMFVLPIWFSMVTNDPICIGCGCGLAICTRDFSVHIVIHSLEKTFSQVHISDWVDWFSVCNWSWILPISVTPVMLNTFQMPLIHYYYYFLSFALIDWSEDVLVSLIDEYFLHSREENVCASNVPVDQMLIQAFFCECLRACLMNLLSISLKFFYPLWLRVLESLSHIVRNISSCFMVESVISDWVKFST